MFNTATPVSVKVHKTSIEQGNSYAFWKNLNFLWKMSIFFYKTKRLQEYTTKSIEI